MGTTLSSAIRICRFVGRGFSNPANEEQANVVHPESIGAVMRL
jgi:hypothetical protein